MSLPPSLMYRIHAVSKRLAKQSWTWYVQKHLVVQNLSNNHKTHKDLPTQFLTTSSPVTANLVIASFGSSTGYNSEAFPLSIQLNSNTPVSTSEKPIRYGKLPEIHHVFRPGPRSPNIVISCVFTVATLATPFLLVGAVSLRTCHYRPILTSVLSGWLSAATSITSPKP